VKSLSKHTRSVLYATKTCSAIFKKKLLPVFLTLTFLCFQVATSQAQIISTVAGNGSTGYSTGSGVATAAAIDISVDVTPLAGGGFIFSSFGNDLIQMVTSGGALSNIAGTPTVSGYTGDGGLATAATLNNPSRVVFDNSGNIFFTDYANHVVRRIDASTGIITTVAGTGASGYTGDGGAATSAKLNLPRGLAFDATGNMYIADWGNNAIRKIDGSGVISTYAGTGTLGYSGDGGLATSAELYNPSSVVLDASNNLYIADTRNNVIRVVYSSTGNINTYAGVGTGGFSGDNGPATSAEFYRPIDIVIDGSSNMFIADSWNNRIRRIDNATGNITTYAGTGTAGFGGDGGPATAADLNQPAGLGIDASGNLYIADQLNNRIRMITAPPTPPSCSDTCYWKVTGNNIIGGNNTFGTLTSDDINIVTNNTARGIFTSQGLFGLYGNNSPSAPTAYLDVECDNHNADLSGTSDIRFRNLESNTDGNIVIIDPATGYVFDSKKGINTMPSFTCTTADFMPKFTNTSGELGCSQVYDDGTSVGINSTGPFGYTFPGGVTWVTGATAPAASGTIQLDVNGVTRSLAYIATSDERYKTNIAAIKDPFKIINSLNGKTYNWNELARSEKHADGSKQYGFIAQEVAETFPGAAVKDQEGNYGLFYNSFIPVLVEGEKELHAQLQEVKNKNEALENRISELEQKLDMLINCCGANNTGLNTQQATGGNKLYQNVPNPFGKETEIKYFINKINSNAAILVTDVNGREVYRHTITSTGNGSMTVKVADIVPGVYLYTLFVDGASVDTKRMVLGE
jgi:sugar lactone lactonase YvrE